MTRLVTMSGWPQTELGARVEVFDAPRTTAMAGHKPPPHDGIGDTTGPGRHLQSRVVVVSRVGVMAWIRGATAGERLVFGGIRPAWW